MSPQLKRDAHFGKRYVRRNIVKMVPLLIGIASLWIGWPSGFNLATGVAVLSFAIGIVMWARDDRRLFKNYHCPDCGAHIPETTIKHPGEGDPIIYYCSACDTEWDTALRG